ncbi:MAG: type III-B CRISPR-associated protein Cas10/Cmr2 [archaeon YNP-LCB-003-016]|uniref:type III-B CRISPR-associated protein Cas10/Cmr2 n=1 Tax=Candidatus Culexarchaeum yellowstonense TaxID=2928963 RepID=UPI0026E9C1BD|nr:type III-B CRISPR-associated protein Cas10/Cmr2 [Candidatus Culexarchaeum yellowstonense]MCR6692232.1 type III-B CRISPR-associated protein Cas10/Cmr2 [Candidatus Culexarchaeum yellowstonense]
MRNLKSDNDIEKEYFGAKAWALLHDPPHKMWIVGGDLKAAEGGHVKEAQNIWRLLGLRSIFGSFENYDKLVNFADDMASTSDRWITNFAFRGVGRIFKYNRLHNIFNPDFSLEIKPPKYSDVEKFLNGLAGQISVFSNDSRCTYHALYALYETLWIVNGLPPSLADTRAPTHTLFDHVYATALTLNMLWPKGEVGGYATLVDIPGIQRIVGTARKAGDFWAGSWIVSMLSWLTVWPLIWEYGADILLKPSPRFNPYYHAFLCAKLNARDESRQVFEALYTRMVELGTHRQMGIIPLQCFPLKFPIIPGTTAFILPERDLRGQELSDHLVEGIVKKRFIEAYDLILTLASGEKGEFEEPYDALARLLKIKGSETPLIKLFRKIKEEESKVFEGLLRPRIAVININKYYREWLRALEGEATIEDKPKILKALVEAKYELLKLGVSEEDINKRLTWQALIALLFEELSRKARRKIVPPKAWFTLGENTFKPIVDFEKFYDKKGVGYLLCTTCGTEPAIIKLGKDVRRPRLLEYSNDALNKLADLSLSKEDIERLKVYVKPGEALGPFCLMKRALYTNIKESIKSFEESLGIKFDSTEDVSMSFVRNQLLNLTSYLRKLGDEGSKVAQYIEEEGKSFDSMLDQNPESARSMYEKALNFVFHELISREQLQNLLGKLSEELTDIYAVKGFQLPEKFLVTFRNYYCILRADADNVGDLSRGKIKIDSYFKLFEKLWKEAKERGEEDIAKAFDTAKSIVESFLNKLNKVIGEELLLPSTTYSLILSTVLMVTALKDSINVEFKLHGSPIFSGGDDDLALLPVETGLATVELLYNTYHGEYGFHKISNYAIPAPVVYGKSFSLRFVNILDLMSSEISECTMLLDDVAKETKWSICDKEFSKNTLVLSSSRSSNLSILPLTDKSDEQCGLTNVVSSAFKVLELMWLANTSLQLSASVPEDYDQIREAVEMAVKNDYWDVAHQMVLHVLSRNTPQGKFKGEVFNGLTNELIKIMKGKQKGKVPLFIEERESLELSAFSWLMEAYRIMRGYP